MSIRFKLELIRRLERSPKNGFVLPIVLMIGLIILVAGAAILIKAQGDQNNVVSQKAKASSMAAAETGLARMQNLFANAKFVSLYNNSDWATAVNSSGIPVNGTNSATGLGTTTADQWAKYINYTASGGNAACGVTSSSSTAKTALQAQLATLKTLSGGTTQTIDGKNSFRLVKYQYAGTSGQLPTGQVIGRLTIEGKSTEGGGEAVSRLMVDIPISGSVTAGIPSGTKAPGLWLKQQGINDVSKPETAPDTSSGTFDANIMLSDCTGAISTGYISALNTIQQARANGPFTAEKATLGMPPVPAIPNGVTPYDLSGSATLPRAGETVAADGYYYYQVGSSASPQDLSDLTINHTDNKKFRIYLYGNIPKTTEVNSNCSSTSGCKPTNLQIFGMKDSGSICMNGNNDRQVDAIVLAPNYDMGKTGNGGFYGTFMVKTFGKLADCGSNNGKLAVTQTETWDDFPPELKPVSIPMPTIASFSGWQQLAADADPPAPPAPN